MVDTPPHGDSYQFQGQNLNKSLLPGPTLGASLLGVLLRFREHAVVISGDRTSPPGSPLARRLAPLALPVAQQPPKYLRVAGIPIRHDM